MYNIYIIGVINKISPINPNHANIAANSLSTGYSNARKPFCTILGVFSFPFYDTVIYTYLINTSVVQKLYALFPSFVGNEFILQVKLMVSLVWYLFRNFIFPLMGLFLIIFNLYKDDCKKGLDTIVNAARILTILCIAYSVIEVSWLWSGSDY